MLRIWAVEISDGRKFKVRIFDTCAEADEFARDLRRVANEQGKAIKLGVWELTEKIETLPGK